MTTTNATYMKNLITALKKIQLTEDDDFLTTVNTTAQQIVSEKKTKKTKDPSKKRPPTAYNLFVQEKMQDEDIKDLPHKERMKAISELWNEQKNSQ